MKVSHKEQGLALLMLVFLLALVAIGYGVNALDSSGLKNERNRKTGLALSEAKAALIGSVAARPFINDRPYLPNPSLALTSNSEGKESFAPLGGVRDISLIGKFPWFSLKTLPFKDGWNECLWYVVSGRYKNTPETTVFNWDTLGQIDVIDGNGNILAVNLAALIISPGPAIDGQNRSLASSDYRSCGGNNDAKNYLDAFDSENAASGQLNYFSGSVLNRVATSVDNKKFVMTKNDHFNDQFIFVTSDDLFDVVIKRKDFKDQIDNVISNTDFHSYLINKGVSGNKGTDNVTCSDLAPYDTFCNNWLEMFLFTRLSTPSPVTIDGVTTSNCNYVLIFGGKKTSAQSRFDNVTKNDPSNYLEGTNTTAFATTVANSNNFVGNSSFDPENPDRDILRCI
jgi:hypothetical protein